MSICNFHFLIFDILHTAARQNAATDLTDFQGANEDEGGQHQTIATLLKETLLRDKLNLLSEKNLVEAVNEFVDKNEKDAISESVIYQLMLI